MATFDQRGQQVNRQINLDDMASGPYNLGTDGLLYRRCDATCDTCPGYCWRHHPVGCTCESCVEDSADDEFGDYDDDDDDWDDWGVGYYPQ